MTNTDKLIMGSALIKQAAANSTLGTASSFVPMAGGLLSGVLGNRPNGTTAPESVIGQTQGGMAGGGLAALLSLIMTRKSNSPGLQLASLLGSSSLGTAAGTGLARFSMDKNVLTEEKLKELMSQKSASMTNSDKLITAVYLCETEKQAMLGKAKELGMKGLDALKSTMAEGQAKTIGDKFKDIALGGKEGLRDIGNFMGRATGKKNLFGESLPHMYTGSKYQAAGHAGVLGGAGGLVGGGAAELATRGIRSHNDKLRSEGAAGAQKGMKDQVDQNGYMRNLLNAIMNKPLGQ